MYLSDKRLLAIIDIAAFSLLLAFIDYWFDIFRRWWEAIRNHRMLSFSQPNYYTISSAILFLCAAIFIFLINMCLKIPFWEVSPYNAKQQCILPKRSTKYTILHRHYVDDWRFQNKRIDKYIILISSQESCSIYGYRRWYCCATRHRRSLPSRRLEAPRWSTTAIIAALRHHQFIVDAGPHAADRYRLPSILSIHCRPRVRSRAI